MKRVTALRFWVSNQKPIPRAFILLVMLLVSACVLIVLFYLASILISQPWIIIPAVFTNEVEVEIGDGWIDIEPAMIRRSHTIVFNVTNVGEEAHMFLVLDADLTAENLPVENGQVRSSPYFDEPFDLHWLDPAGHDVTRLGAARGSSISPAEGPIIEPGETREIDYDWGYDRFPSGLTLILFCNYPEHYERGEFAILSIE